MMEYDPAVKAKLVRTCRDIAESVQAKLPLFPLRPMVKEDLKFFSTLQIHSIYMYTGDLFLKHNIEPSRRRIYTKELPTISFSIGFTHEDIASTIDDIGIFDSEAIAIEISQFADSRVKIDIMNQSTIYSDGNLVVQVVNDALEETRVNKECVMENMPILSMIVSFKGFLKSIIDATGSDESIDYFEHDSDVLNLTWNFPWTEKQIFVKENFEISTDDKIAKALGGNLFGDEIKILALDEVFDLKKVKETAGAEAALTFLLNKLKENRKRKNEDEGHNAKKKQKL